MAGLRAVLLDNVFYVTTENHGRRLQTKHDNALRLRHRLHERAEAADRRRVPMGPSFPNPAPDKH
jgi:hypothetical protein